MIELWRLRLNSLLARPLPETTRWCCCCKASGDFKGSIWPSTTRNARPWSACSAPGRPRQKTLLFYTKEEPARIENLIDAPRYRALRAKLDGLIAGCTSADLVYLPPVDALRHEHYLDHTHLTYAGYQVLVERMWPRLRPLVGDVFKSGPAVPLSFRDRPG